MDSLPAKLSKLGAKILYNPPMEGFDSTKVFLADSVKMFGYRGKFSYYEEDNKVRMVMFRFYGSMNDFEKISNTVAKEFHLKEPQSTIDDDSYPARLWDISKPPFIHVMVTFDKKRDQVGLVYGK